MTATLPGYLKTTSLWGPKIRHAAVAFRADHLSGGGIAVWATTACEGYNAHTWTNSHYVSFYPADRPMTHVGEYGYRSVDAHVYNLSSGPGSRAVGGYVTFPSLADALAAGLHGRRAETPEYRRAWHDAVTKAADTIPRLPTRVLVFDLLQPADGVEAVRFLHGILPRQ